MSGRALLAGLRLALIFYGFVFGVLLDSGALLIFALLVLLLWLWELEHDSGRWAR